MTVTAAKAVEPQGFDWRAAQKAREAEALANFDPTVPGIPGDGSGIVLHTDTERGLTYTWYDVSRRVQDFTGREKGYIVSRLAVTHTSGHEVAYLNVSHTTPELMASLFANGFEWADENTGAIFGFRWAREEGREVSPQQVWATAYTDLDLTPPSAQGRRGWGSYSASDAPSDPAVLAAELAAAEKVYARQMRGMTRWLAMPFVDYAHVDGETYFTDYPEGHPGPLRGTGVGRQMYLLAAQFLATRGKVLRASGLQTEEAQGLWQRLVADPTVPTRKTRRTYYQPSARPTDTYWCLDYTRTPDSKDTDR